MVRDDDRIIRVHPIFEVRGPVLRFHTCWTLDLAVRFPWNDKRRPILAMRMGRQSFATPQIPRAFLVAS